jgi:hypothetical protein
MAFASLPGICPHSGEDGNVQEKNNRKRRGRDGVRGFMDGKWNLWEKD